MIMKKLRVSIHKVITHLENRWDLLPRSTQLKYTFIGFVGYCIITLFMVLQIWWHAGVESHTIDIEHIGSYQNSKSGIAKDSIIQTEK